MLRKFFIHIGFFSILLHLSLLYAEDHPVYDGVKDLGQYGMTFEIAEENMLDYLKNKLNTMAQNGSLLSLEEKWKAMVIKRMQHPRPVEELGKTKIKRSWFIDPSLIIENDITTPQGEIIAKKGQKINPLHHVKLQRGFIFIDGDDEAQVEFSKKYLQTHTLVLVKGAPLDLQETIKVPVYFDQDGVLTQKYGIQNVPATLTMREDQLLLQEEPCDA